MNFLGQRIGFPTFSSHPLRILCLASPLGGLWGWGRLPLGQHERPGHTALLRRGGPLRARAGRSFSGLCFLPPKNEQNTKHKQKNMKDNEVPHGPTLQKQKRGLAQLEDPMKFFPEEFSNPHFWDQAL